MASVFDVNAAFVIKYRRTALVLAGQGGFGKDKVKLGQKLHIQAQLFYMGSRLIA